MVQSNGLLRKVMEILVFELGGQRYGLLVSEVQELLRVVAMVSLPKAPTVVEGVINLRGKIIPVLDIRSRFRLVAKPVEHTDHLVVARAGTRLVAIRVDRAVNLQRVDAAEVEDAKGVVPGVEYVAWVAKSAENLVLIHDLATFLSRAEAAALDRVLSATQAKEQER